MSDDAPATSGDMPLPPPTGAPVQLPQPPKKPVFKKWWFWVLVALGLLLLVSFWGSGSDSGGSSSDSQASEPVDPQTLTGSTLKEAVDALRASGVPDEGIAVVGTITMGSVDDTVYDSSRFTVENSGDSTFQESQKVCGVRVDDQGTSSELVILWSESSCAEGEERLAEFQAAAEPTPVQETPAPEPAVEETAEEPAVEETAEEPVVEESVDEGAVSAAFELRARGDIADLAKDLDDMAEAAAEGGFFRVLGNSVELSFNVGQLQSLTPPEQIANDWDKALTRLSNRVDAISDAIGEESDANLIERIGSAAKALIRLSEVVDQLDS